MASASSYKVFGIRHHGPQSAKLLCKALEEYAPSQILIEGPPEASNLLDFIADDDLVPPVALLVWAKTAPELAAFFPFAVFSPEWQAAKFAVQNGIPCSFMDFFFTCVRCYRTPH